MSASVTHQRSWKHTWRIWGFLIFLCLLGVIAALGAWAILKSVRTATHPHYDAVLLSLFVEQERERQGLERPDRIILEKGNEQDVG